MILATVSSWPEALSIVAAVIAIVGGGLRAAAAITKPFRVWGQAVTSSQEAILSKLDGIHRDIRTITANHEQRIQTLERTGTRHG